MDKAISATTAITKPKGNDSEPKFERLADKFALYRYRKKYHAAVEFEGRHLDWTFDSLEALRRWPAARKVQMLHSGRTHQQWARWSILAEPIGVYRFMQRDSNDVKPRGQSQWLGSAPCPARTLRHRPFSDLRTLLAGAPESIWIGHLGYDLGRWIEKLPTQATRDRQWPIIELGLCPGWFAYDGLTKQWLACGTWAKALPFSLDQLPEKKGTFAASGLERMFDRASYEQAVARSLAYIGAGDIFQVNLAQRMTASLRGQWPTAQRSLYEKLATISPAWYGAYLELADVEGEPARAIASTSPELFLEMDQQRRVVTRPIKGTRPASVDAAELRDSVKDTAELNMIVDLLRNDLGRVCAYGSVKVTEPRVIESHPTVHHGVATIEGQLHAACDVPDLLRATLPGGSIVGAPKVRAMEIIDELEPVRRGPYCGCIGMLSERQCCLNIAIRTMLIEAEGDTGRADFSIGGGIVADSEPAAEYAETLDKAAAILRALGLDGEAV